MLFRLSLKNIKHSLRDYAVYFFTLIIAVSIFYVFNAVGGQAATLGASSAGATAAKMVGDVLASISLFVSMVLGVLIVHASRFLMKRRNKEFALYMLLGVSKRRISATLVTETFIIGVASLAVGLVLGVGLSQLMSALAASLFEADMTAYRFTVSKEAITKTIVNFGFMYLVVMLLNSFSVTRMKLIDLMQSGKKSEKVKFKNPLLCTIVFIIAALMLADAYFMVCASSMNVSVSSLGFAILVGIVGTLLLFWSLSGFFLRIALTMRRRYFSGLNSFTVRQISSKINTVVVSMSMICIMLFFTICMLSSAFAVRNGLYGDLDSSCPADFEVSSTEVSYVEQTGALDDIIDHYARYGFDVTAPLGDYVHFHSYRDENVMLRQGTDELADALNLSIGKIPVTEILGTVVRESDYNRLMDLYGRERIELEDDQFAVVCNYKETKGAFDRMLKGDVTAEVFGRELSSRFQKSQEGFINLSNTKENLGFLLVPDAVAAEDHPGTDYLIGNYNAESLANLEATEQMVAEQLLAVDRVSNPASPTDENYWVKLFTKDGIKRESINSGALMTFVCLYLGLVFLVSSGALLALRGLSDSVDSVGRYDTLRKIGASEDDIVRSLFCQTGFFFLLPLLVACFHSIFGMKFMLPIIVASGAQNIMGSVIGTIVIILGIYGGYFLTTFLGSKRIIQGQV